MNTHGMNTQKKTSDLPTKKELRAIARFYADTKYGFATEDGYYAVPAGGKKLAVFYMSDLIKFCRNEESARNLVTKERRRRKWIVGTAILNSYGVQTSMLKTMVAKKTIASSLTSHVLHVNHLYKFTTQSKTNESIHVRVYARRIKNIPQGVWV